MVKTFVDRAETGTLVNGPLTGVQVVRLVLASTKRLVSAPCLYTKVLNEALTPLVTVKPVMPKSTPVANLMVIGSDGAWMGAPTVVG